MTLCLRGWRWAAVAVAAPVLALAAGFMTASPARATPPTGVTTQILGSGTTLGGFKIHVDGIKVESKSAASFTVAHLTFAPGGTTGWHVHPGPVLVTVISGSVTKFSADCTAQTYTTGQAFVENGPSDENMVRNDGSVERPDHRDVHHPARRAHPRGRATATRLHPIATSGPQREFA